MTPLRCAVGCDHCARAVVPKFMGFLEAGDSSGLPIGPEANRYLPLQIPRFATRVGFRSESIYWSASTVIHFGANNSLGLVGPKSNWRLYAGLVA
jgi:hypothetical protein